MRRLSLLLLILLLLPACASNRLAPGYAITAIPDGPLAVLPVQGVPVIANPDDVTEALGPGVPDAVYTQFLRERLVEILPSEGTFAEATLAEAPTVALTPRAFREGVRLPVPADGTALDVTVNAAPAAFALFLGNAVLRRAERQSNPNADSGYDRLMVLQVDYVLWDVAQAKPALAGRARVEEATSVSNPVSQTFFERRFEGLAEEIVRGTPFER